MPIIRIDFDTKQVSQPEIEQISHAVRDIVSEKTEIKEVFVYVNQPLLVLDADPVEIFVEMSAHIMEQKTDLMNDVKSALSAWKKENKYKHQINLTLIPMNWQLEIDI